jgi:hypothetical protein
MEVFGLGGWRLGFDPHGGVTVRDWLAVPWQRLAEVTWTARRLSAISATPGPLPRYLVSDRDMSVLGVSDTQT